MEPVTHTMADRKQNNDLGFGALVQQSLGYRPWLKDGVTRSCPR